MTATPGAPRLAPVGRRVTAFTVDAVVVLGVAALVLVLTDEPLYAALALVELVVALCVWEARSGATVGNALCSVRTARTDGRHAPGIRRVVLRALVVAAGALVAVVGQWVVVASAAWDRGPLRQGWHDAVAGTTMVDVSRRRTARGRRAQAAPGEPVADAYRPVVGPGPDTAFRPPTLVTPAGSSGRVPLGTTAAHGPDLGAPAVHAAPAAPAPMPPAAPAPAAPALPATPVAPATPTPITSVPGARRAQDGAPARYLLSFDNGQSFLVGGSGLIGRKPRSGDGEHHEDLVAVSDDDRSVSKTHLEFGIDAEGFWVGDRGSTNGTAVLAAHGDPLEVLPGMRVHVPADGSVRVGQRQFTATRVAR